jgi:sporulation integral membrane protein YlbJ
MFGAVAIGMLGTPALGAVLAGSVYGANIIVGLLFRFYGRREESLQLPFDRPSRGSAVNPFSRASQKLRSAQKSNQPLGIAFAESTKKNVAILLQIGGYIVFFSVLIRLLKHWSVLSILSRIPAKLIEFVYAIHSGEDPGDNIIGMCEAVFTGLVEQALGSSAAASVMPTLASQVGAIAFLMGCGGLCVFAQVSGIVSKTDLRMKPFLIARLLHGILALVLSQIAVYRMNLTASTAQIQGVLSDLTTEIVSPAIAGRVMSTGLTVFTWNLLFFGVFLLVMYSISLQSRKRSQSRKQSKTPREL